VLGDHHQSIVCRQQVVDDYLRQWFHRQVRQRNENDEFHLQDFTISSGESKKQVRSAEHNFKY
jgi:hypothetical protein